MKLREVRKRKGVTQEELAKRINVNRATISKYESGQIKPSLYQIQEIAHALGVTAWELLSDDISDNLKSVVNRVNQKEFSREEFLKASQEVDALIDELEAHKNDPNDLDLLAAYRKLNIDGQKVAIERVEELTQIPKYRATNHHKQLPDENLTKDTPEQEKPPKGP